MVSSSIGKTAVPFSAVLCYADREVSENMTQKICDSTKWCELIQIMARLRGENGCPWDLEQDHDSLKRYLLEEAYEVLDAIERRNDVDLCDELGDLLLQVVFHAQIATEQGRFTIDDVVSGINAKMIRRHPHIFGQAQAEDSAQVLSMWEAIKAQERASDGPKAEKRGLMKVNQNLPALMMAQKVQEKASRVGFDWPDITGPKEKLQEELVELQSAATQEERVDEFGDVLFAMVNLARFLQVDAEEALRHTIKKFIARFAYIEQHMEEQGLHWGEATLEQLDQLWNEAKGKGL